MLCHLGMLREGTESALRAAFPISPTAVGRVAERAPGDHTQLLGSGGGFAREGEHQASLVSFPTGRC